MDKVNSAVFLTVVEAGSFKSAADRLGYTQAGISYIINAMEEAIGLRLFYREHGGVRLTSEGAELLPFIRQMNLNEHYLKEKINDLKGLISGEVRVSVYNAAYMKLLPGIIRQFRSEYPGIGIEVVSCEDNRDNEQLIFSRDVDCGFLPEKPLIQIDAWELMEDPLLVAVSADSPFAKAEKFPVSELGRQPYIMISFDKPDFLRKVFPEGVRPKTAFVVDNEFAAMAMASSGQGICVFSGLLKDATNLPIVFKELEEPVTRTICLCTRSMGDCTAATRAFMECARRWIQNP